jgi:hypothetical protein
MQVGVVGERMQMMRRVEAAQHGEVRGVHAAD